MCQAGHTQGFAGLQPVLQALDPLALGDLGCQRQQVQAIGQDHHSQHGLLRQGRQQIIVVDVDHRDRALTLHLAGHLVGAFRVRRQLQAEAVGHRGQVETNAGFESRLAHALAVEPQAHPSAMLTQLLQPHTKEIWLLHDYLQLMNE